MNLTEMGPRDVNAVATTGIYCRAGCAGRPRAENCTIYPSAVAAEAAGYRPCLKCRPDRRDSALLDGGTPEVVRQALMLITDGFLDTNSEEQLGRGVGASTRHLRRLFAEYVGATPAFVARSRRAHFARRLIDESDLPFADISAAAGFRSVRQMNRVTREVFRFTPTELRAKRRASHRLVADGGLRLRVPCPDGFDFGLWLRWAEPRVIPGVESVRGGVYRRVTNTCGYPGVIELTRAAKEDELEVVAHLPTFAGLVDDAARVRRMLGIDADFAEARAALAEDRVLGPVVESLPGVTAPGAWDRFEISTRIILGQQITVKAATTISGRIAQRFGTAVPGLDEFDLGYLFPPAKQLAAADLAGLGMPESRAVTIGAFAAAVAEGRLNLYEGDDLPSLLARLEEMPGIGPWSSNMIAMRVYGHLDAFPASDLGLRRGAARLLGRDGLSRNELEQLAERWRPWRSLAATYLWRFSQLGG